MFHPGAGALLGAFLAAVLGRDQGQDHKRHNGKYDEQKQQRPGKTFYKSNNSGNRRYKPQRNNHGYMFFEFIAETFDGFSVSKIYGDMPVAAGTRPRIEIVTERANKNHNPQSAGRSIREIGNRQSQGHCRACEITAR